MTAGQGTASTADVAGYERAAHAVFEPIAQLVARRRARAAAGTAPDAVEMPAQVQDVCVWAAGACYLLADAVLRAGVPEPNPVAPRQVAGVAVTVQAIAYLSAIEDWLVSAAESGGGLPSRLLPADPPPLMAPGAPDGYFARACIAALTALRAQLVGDVAALRRALPASDVRMAPLDEALARLGTVADYVGNLFAADLSALTLGRIVDQTGPAIALGFRAGQVLAGPYLLDLAPSSLAAPEAMLQGTAPGGGVTVAPPARRWGAPGAADFDRWALSDPHARIALDSAAHRAELDAFWRVPAHAALIRLQNLIEQGIAAGQIGFTVGAHGRFAAPHARLPWAPVYTVQHPLRLGDEHLVPGQTFTLGIGPDDPPDAAPVVLVDTFAVNAAGRSEGRRRRALPRPLPGSAGFDPWVATDPRAHGRLRDPARLTELQAIWQNQATASATLALLDAVQAEVAAGGAEVARREGSGAWLGSASQVPWAPVWMARQAITVAGMRVTAGRHFTLRVTADGSGIALGPFAPADLLGDAQAHPAGRGGDAGASAALPAAPPRSRATRAEPPSRTPVAGPAAPERLPRPGEPGFDVWSASDPHSRGMLRAQGARAQLEQFWKDAARAERLLGVIDQVNAARRAASVDYATAAGGRWAGRFAGAPWGPVLVATRAITVDDVEIPAGTLFAWRGQEPALVLGPFIDSPDGAVPPSEGAVLPPDGVAPSPTVTFDLERDRWRLTDPHARGRLRHDAAANQAIDAFWAADPDPAATLAAYAQVETAIGAGDLSYRVRSGTGAWEHPLDEAPYCARLEVRRDLTLLGTPLKHGRVVAFRMREHDGTLVRALRPC